jgi:dTDP-4-dehydrorhamnose reductase
MTPHGSNERRRLLVIGGSGGVGAHLVAALSDRWAITTTQRNSSQDQSTFFDAMHGASPKLLKEFDVVMYVAGVTSLKVCEEDVARSEVVNQLTPTRLAQECTLRGQKFIFFSSNAASEFDSLTTSESIAVQHQRRRGASTYGLHKALAERAILELPHVTVIRLSKVALPVWPLIQTWFRRLANGEAIDAFEDHYVSPIDVNTVCKATSRVLETQMGGLVELSAVDELSYAEIGRGIARMVGSSESLIVPVSAEANLDLRHVMRSGRLNTSRAQELLDEPLPTSMDVIAQYS